MSDSVYLSVRQVATRWGVSKSIVYALVAGGQLACIRVGLGRGTIRILESEAERYASEKRRDDEQSYAEHFV